MLTLPSKSPSSLFPALVFHWAPCLGSALVSFLQTLSQSLPLVENDNKNPTHRPPEKELLLPLPTRPDFSIVISPKSRFILVHLNIHDSLHFCSKRHLFI
uniref:Uncharacterized protein n=1 Tax=Buteo japonicus TaxID=224669 RepID=A0A8C0AYX9_9AVES